MTMTMRKTSLRLASLLGPIALAATVMAASPAAADSWYAPGASCPPQYQYEPYCDEGPAYGVYPPGFYPYYGYDFRNHDFDHHNGDHHDGGFNHGGNVGHGGNFSHGSGGGFSHGGHR
jgi:hypothetical protein